MAFCAFRVAVWGFCGCVALALGGCGTDMFGNAPEPELAKPVESGPPPISGAIAGTLGAQLSEADRRKAFDASLQALDRQKHTTWAGSSGSYGFVEVAPIGDGRCDKYTHRIYISGRPVSGSGEACKSAKGGWDFTS